MRSTDQSTLRIIDLWTFKSTKSNKRYIVEIEYFSNHFLGLRDKCASFGFVAADDLNNADNPNQPNKRFRFYRRMMLSIFGSETFAQGYDMTNSIYLLINNKMLSEGTLSLPSIEKEISRLYEGEFSLVLES